jgi:quercetin dioxygenase-like cupin family protein
MRTSVIALLCSVAAVPAIAQSPHSAATVKWGPGPAFLPAGARFAVIQGDPGKSGPYTIRLKLPTHYTFRPHFHPTDEHVTVLSGVFLVGMGDTMGVRRTQRLTAGGFITAPADAHHFAYTRAPTILQIHGEGPFAITYVKSADDPRNAKPAP